MRPPSWNLSRASTTTCTRRARRHEARDENSIRAFLDRRRSDAAHVRRQRLEPGAERGSEETTMTHLSRRAFVRGAVALSSVPGLVAKAHVVRAQSGRGKPFAGKTLNVFTFDHPYPRALKTLVPH